ncbi:MAG: hexokinase [Kiritimatiellia bacterium]|jgi:hexokinase|nr:hexokinase [Kiritimatiellia bacterium]MDP6630667.1 hexokinase [Kiritimatiellia bacterium]MDP6809470.1 hexokinase [Kiritimatiellia bacterium]MDP7023853.1 hexokinase [Kiritimatiellia bacterium]
MAPTDIQSWLKEQMVSVDAYDADALVERFLSEMERGLNGEPSSLAMIPAYVSSEGDVPADKPVAVIDAGGTNLRIGIARFDADGQIQLEHFSKQAIPGRDVEACAAEFFAVMVDALEPVQDAFDDIGFCFSYPASITPDYDGKLLHWTKEIKVPELVGAHVGAGLLAALDARGIAGKNVVVLNDTVAALLAGVAAGQAFDASSYIGFILGTGTNTAYVEQNRTIGKLPGLHESGSQVINVESGGFTGFERGSIDLAMDAESENPGKHVFEKTISGVYMGPLALRLMKGLVTEGVFSEDGGKSLAEMTELSTIEIDNLCADNGRDVGVLGTDGFTDADREVMKEVFGAVVDRAALLTAVNLTAAIVKSGAGQDPDRPVCINIDGSTYYKTFRMPEKVQAQLQRLLGARGLHIRCIQVDDAPVVGAAIAGLTTF